MSLTPEKPEVSFLEIVAPEKRDVMLIPIFMRALDAAVLTSDQMQALEMALDFTAEQVQVFMRDLAEQATDTEITLNEDSEFITVPFEHFQSARLLYMNWLEEVAEAEYKAVGFVEWLEGHFPEELED